MKLLLLIPVLLIGSCHIMWEGNRPPLPKTAQELKVEVATIKMGMEGLDEELAQRQRAVEVRERALENAEGYWQKEEAGRNLSNAEMRLDFTRFQVNSWRKRLVKAEEALKKLEQE